MSRRMTLLLELLVNFLLPWLCYRWARPHWGEMGGLLLSAAPPLMWSGWELWRSRRVDAMGMLVLLGIALSLLAMALGGGEKMLLLRESLLSGLFGAAFLLSLLFPRPLVFFLARAALERQRQDGREHCERLWAQAAFRRGMRFMTAMWGLGLVSEMLLRSWLAWHWPVERSVLLLPWISYGVMGLLCGATWLLRRRLTVAMQLAAA
ncbi:VC0807 family protein [Chromobacterium subtsugae]|uniref:VC0807 family protein n=1 Tax=Chromobacterium subtsugae TaxID=251747 RepID=UPI000640F3DD|nr:VC0807 family protein [Chromobacterium subtsugae]